MLFAPSESKNTSMPINALADLLKMAYPALMEMGDQDATFEVSSPQDLLAILEQVEQFVDEDIQAFYHTYLAYLKEVIYGSGL